MDPQQAHTRIEQKLPLLFGAAVVVVLAVAGYLYVANQGLFPPRADSVSATSGEIVRDAAIFLDKAYDTNIDGFQPSFTCQGGTCTPIPVPPALATLLSPYPSHAILAYRELARSTGNAQYEQSADASAEALLSACLDASEPTLCRGGTAVFAAYYEATGDRRFLDALRRGADAVLAESFTPATPGVSGFALFGVGAPFVTLHEATGDERYRNHLVTLADRALANEEVRGEVHYRFENMVPLRSNEVHIAHSLYLPAYQATGDNLYLEAAKGVATRAEFLTHLQEYDTRAMSRELVRGLNLLLELAELDPTQSNLYRTQAKAVAQYLVLTRFDSPSNQKFNGDHGFLQTNDVVDNAKVTDVTGWMVRLLIKMPEEEFRLI